MNFAKACHRHTLITTRSPPVESIGCIELARVASTGVGRAHKIGVLMDIRTICIAEDTPADGVEVGFVRDVEVTVHTILENTVIYPTVLGTRSRDEVITPHVDSARPYKGDVTDDDVLFVQREDTRLTVVLVAILCIKRLASDIFGLLFNRLTIQCSSLVAGAHIFYASYDRGVSVVSCIVEKCLVFVSQIPLGADTCIVDAEDGLVASLKTNVLRYDKFSVSTIKDNDVVLLNSVLDGTFHVLTIGLQNDFCSIKGFVLTIVIDATASDSVGTAGVSTRRYGTEAERLI